MDKCGGQKARKRKEAHGDKKIKNARISELY
jgi:hypothetical protein